MDHGGVKVGLLMGTCALLLLWGLGCSASSQTCSLEAVRDRVSRIPVGQSASQAVAIGEYVSAATGDSIGVDALGLAQLEFPDLVKVEIYRDSQLRVRDVPSQGNLLVDLYLTLGSIFCDAPPAARAERRIVVGTEWAQIESTGTSFIVQYEPGTQITRVGVLEGEVTVVGQELGVIATGGQIVRVDPGQPPTWPETDTALVLQWLEDLRAGRPLATSTSTPTSTPTTIPTPVPSVTRWTWPSPSVAQPTVYVSPTSGPCPPPPRPYWTYTVSRGDTLSGLAQRFHTSVETLMRNNCLTGSLIYTGQRLYIPGYPPTPSPSPTPPTPSPSPPIHAFITYVSSSFTESGTRVTFRIVNAPDGATLECVRSQIVCGGYLFGPASSNAPFCSSPTGGCELSSLAPGATAYLRYRLASAPGQQSQGMVGQSMVSVPCRATFTLYTADNMGGASAGRTVNFALSGAATTTLSPTPTPNGSAY